MRLAEWHDRGRAERAGPVTALDAEGQRRYEQLARDERLEDGTHRLVADAVVVGPRSDEGEHVGAVRHGHGAEPELLEDLVGERPGTRLG